MPDISGVFKISLSLRHQLHSSRKCASVSTDWYEQYNHILSFIFGGKYIIFPIQFSVSQIEYPLEGSSKRDSHVYFLLIVTMVLL